MRLVFLPLLLSLTSLPLLANDPEPPGPAREVNALRGHWRLAHSEVGTLGSEIPFTEVTALTFTAKGVQWHEGKKVKNLTYRLDAKKGLRHIDLIGKDGVKQLGIYKLENDQLTIALPVNGGPRLTSFVSFEHLLIVFQKEKK